MTMVDTHPAQLHRLELASVIERDLSELTDDATFATDICLDSLAMMCLTTWLQSKGVAVAQFREPPATVGEVLELLSKPHLPEVTVRINGNPIGPPGKVAEPERDPLGPILSSKEVRLTPVEPDDLRFLYSMSTHPDTGFRWRYRGAPPPAEKFAADLWNQVLVQFVVRLKDGEPIGHVVSYGADMVQRYVYAGAVFRAGFTGSGLGAQAFRMFARYLFHTFPMRKVYVEIPGYNFPQVASGEDRMFVTEGVMRDHEFYAGRYWDRYLCAIYPEHMGMSNPT